MRKTNYKEQAITLIALVITIIILLILAGVTISMALGQNGLFQRAKLAGEKYTNAQSEEEKRLEEVEDEMTQIQTGVTIEQVTDSAPGILEKENEVKVINSIEDLVFFANDVRKGNTYENKTVKLGANLDFELNKSYVNPNRTDYSKYGYEGNLKTALTTGEGFKTIGVTTNGDDLETKSFKGTFDGNGKVIRNLKIDNTLDNSTEDLRIGLFGSNYGTIKNIGVENCSIKGKIKNENGLSVIAGGIAGYNYGTIESSYVSGYLSGESDSTYETGFTSIGGISGRCASGKILNCLTNCELNVKGNRIEAGGICGLTRLEENLITNCFSNSLINLFKSDKFDGYINAGGILGFSVDGGSKNTLDKNYAITRIIANYNDEGIGCYGGICGFQYSKCTISSCYVGNIEVDAVHGARGGICGAVKISEVTKEDFVCKDCSYYSLKINQYCREEGYDVNVMKVKNKSDLPKIIDVVGEEFKELPSGSVALKWQ